MTIKGTFHWRDFWDEMRTVYRLVIPYASAIVVGGALLYLLIDWATSDTYL